METALKFCSVAELECVIFYFETESQPMLVIYLEHIGNMTKKKNMQVIDFSYGISRWMFSKPNFLNISVKSGVIIHLEKSLV